LASDEAKAASRACAIEQHHFTRYGKLTKKIIMFQKSQI
jgi:hypothetical protein